MGNAASTIRFGSAALLIALLAGCKVMTVDEARATRERHSKDFDAARYVATIWRSQAIPTLTKETVDYAIVMPQIAKGLAAAGARYGHKTGEYAPWTFVVRLHGRVTAVDRSSRRGTITIAPDGGVRAVTVQIGPVVQGTTIRDALPFVAFNDFSDQLAFADVGTNLTADALKASQPGTAQAAVGDEVRVEGTFNLDATEDPVVITPFRFERPQAGT